MVQIFIFKSQCQTTHRDLSYRRCLAAVCSFSKVGRRSFCYLCCLLLVAPWFPGYRIESGTSLLLQTTGDGYLWLVTHSYTQISFSLHQTSQLGQGPFFSACCLCWHCLWGKDFLLFLKSRPPKCPTKACRWCTEAIQKYAHFLDGQMSQGQLFGKQVENTLKLCSFKTSPV